MSVTYVFEEGDQVIAFFSISNDSIKKEDVPRSTFERVLKLIPREKRYSSMPSAKIGRLGVCKEYQKRNIGRMVLDFLKVWFTDGNKTGCRFLVVDAYNKEPVTRFYQTNGFRFLTGADEKEETRIMYFDLKTFRP